MTTDSQTPGKVVELALEGRFPHSPLIVSAADLVAEVAIDALLAAGYAVVKLPEPNADLEFESGMVSPRPGFNRVRLDVEDGRFTAQDAHDLGCELIAAARLSARPDAAERGES